MVGAGKWDSDGGRGAARSAVVAGVAIAAVVDVGIGLLPSNRLRAAVFGDSAAANDDSSSAPPLPPPPSAGAEPTAWRSSFSIGRETMTMKKKTWLVLDFL